MPLKQRPSGRDESPEVTTRNGIDGEDKIITYLPAGTDECGDTNTPFIRNASHGGGAIGTRAGISVMRRNELKRFRNEIPTDARKHTRGESNEISAWRPLLYGFRSRNQTKRITRLDARVDDGVLAKRTRALSAGIRRLGPPPSRLDTRSKRARQRSPHRRCGITPRAPAFAGTGCPTLPPPPQIVTTSFPHRRRRRNTSLLLSPTFLSAFAYQTHLYAARACRKRIFLTRKRLFFFLFYTRTILLCFDIPSDALVVCVVA